MTEWRDVSSGESGYALCVSHFTVPPPPQGGLGETQNPCLTQRGRPSNTRCACGVAGAGAPVPWTVKEDQYSDMKGKQLATTEWC